MLVLALDSTTRTGSVALVDGDRVVDERAGDASRSHAERLPATLLDLMRAHGVTIPQIDLFAVASGPGSFTGLRIGIATMQGFALAAGRPLAGVSALDALAETSRRGVAAGELIAAWMDAHRRDVFTALYRAETDSAAGNGHLIEVEGPTVGDPEATLARWRDLGMRPGLLVGDGAPLFADAIAGALPAARVAPAPPLAAAVARLAQRRATAGAAGHPAALQPLYVRRPDAEVARDLKPRG